MNAPELRSTIEESIRACAWDVASRCLTDFWLATGGPAEAGFVVSRFENLLSHLALVPYRLAILRSFTVEPLVPLLRAGAFSGGINLKVRLGGFNSYAQEMLDANSDLYGFEPDAVILAVQTGDVAPDLWDGYADLTPDERTAAIHRVSGEFRDWIHAFRKNTKSSLIVHTLSLTSEPRLGVLDGQTGSSQLAAIREINDNLLALRSEYRGIYILDYDSLVARHGRISWHDQGKWLAMRMPIASAHLKNMAQEWLRFVCPLAGKVVKALVVDLDNTLWGGVVGEDGTTGIQLGMTYPGAAYRELQRSILDLHRRGILLAICSKNNPEDAMEVLEKHPAMLLRPQHFAAMRINWQSKAQNLREIASELNVGLDAIALLDDNPVEREQVRNELPEVMVLEFHGDPLEQARTLRECPPFERLALSVEDHMRSAYYSARREAEELSRSCLTREDFYRSLQQEVEITPVGHSTLARVAQLTQKTNQFNLTTHRFTEDQIVEMLGRSDWNVYSMRVTDRYGDQGIVGVAITIDTGDECEIDTFLLSCRVIDRTLETAFLSYLGDQARRRNVKTLRGWYLPTKKNAPAKDFYRNHGFVLASEGAEGSLWTLALDHSDVACPSWISLIVPAGAKQ
jgi:FkbH-like protein